MFTHKHDFSSFPYLNAYLSCCCFLDSRISSLQLVEEVCVGATGAFSAFLLRRRAGFRRLRREPPSPAPLPPPPPTGDPRPRSALGIRPPPFCYIRYIFIILYNSQGQNLAELGMPKIREILF